MSNLVINTFKDEKWGNCVKLSNKKIEIVAALDFGPRIMRFNFVGEENIFHEKNKNRISLCIFIDGSAFYFMQFIY